MSDPKTPGATLVEEWKTYIDAVARANIAQRIDALLAAETQRADAHTSHLPGEHPQECEQCRLEDTIATMNAQMAALEQRADAAEAERDGYRDAAHEAGEKWGDLEAKLATAERQATETQRADAAEAALAETTQRAEREHRDFLEACGEWRWAEAKYEETVAALGALRSEGGCWCAGGERLADHAPSCIAVQRALSDAVSDSRDELEAKLATAERQLADARYLYDALMTSSAVTQAARDTAERAVAVLRAVLEGCGPAGEHACLVCGQQEHSSLCMIGNVLTNSEKIARQHDARVRREERTTIQRGIEEEKAYYTNPMIMRALDRVLEAIRVTAPRRGDPR